jgi:hypothetical protein
MDGFAGSAGQPGGAEGAELPGHGEAKVVVVVQIGFFLLPLDTLAVLEQLPLRAAFVTAGLIVGTGTLTRKHDRHLSHKT